MELFVGRTYNSLCPVVAVVRYLAVKGFDTGPLFCWEDGSPVTRPKFVERLRSTLQAAGVDPSHYSGHSFRIGAATVAAANGIGDATIQLLGRWSSDSYARYIRIPRHELCHISQCLSS